mmetsp:Transcript_27651/g.43779  ORF Transcript_27651/g.43779 Transcript_27651/m.43779 type:complete len:458 (+) Transcript_27651:135-1508(+)
MNFNWPWNDNYTNKNSQSQYANNGYANSSVRRTGRTNPRHSNPKRSQPATTQTNTGSYANDNGYYHNISTGHGHGHGHGQGSASRGESGPVRTQCQTFSSKSAQVKKTADMQMFREQVNNTFISISQAAKMSQDPKWDESIVNSVTDGAILALDMFAVSCGEFCKRADTDAVDLAKKTVQDKWSKLQQEDEKTYKLTLPYRDFLISALNGNKNLRYKTYRVASSELDLEAAKQLENDPKALHDTYQKLIANSQQFDREQDEIRGNAEVAERLKKEHDRELQEYRSKAQYAKQTKDDEKSSSVTYSRPNQAALYFTKSGQSASFERLNEKREQKQMEQEIFGGDDSEQENAYKQIPADLPYPHNAMLLLSKQHKLGRCSKPIPCKVLYPKNKSKVYQRIHVQPAVPFDDARMQYPAKMLCFDVEKVRHCEQRHKHKYGKLGYESIAEIESAMDLDEFE